jgi:hypothetical protein
MTWRRKGATRLVAVALAGLLLACSPEEAETSRAVADAGKAAVKIASVDGAART